MRPRPLPALLVLVAAGPVFAHQTPPASERRTAAISGVVVDGMTKQPVAGALVSLATPLPGAERPSAQLTDAKGRFIFPALPAASYTATADRFGYLPGAYSRRPDLGTPPTPIALRVGEWIADIQILIWRRSSLTGLITDERGEPVADVFVRAMTLVRLQGHDQLVAGSLTTTDDRGVYRLSDLLAGRYLVQVPVVPATLPIAGVTSSITPAGVRMGTATIESGIATRQVLNQYPLPPPPLGGRTRAYATTFHPSARGLRDAQVVTLGAGEERTADVRIDPVDVFRVSGRVEGPPESLAGLTLRLMPTGLEALGLGSEAATALVAPDGSFAFAHVPAGAYVIDAPRVVTELAANNRMPSSRTMLPRPPGRGGWSSWAQSIEMTWPSVALSTINYRGDPPNYWARTAVEVDGADLTDVTVTMRPAGILSGMIIPDQEEKGTLLRGDIFLEPASAALTPARLTANIGPNQPPGRFAITGLLEGRYWLRYRDPNWAVKTIMWKGRDHTDVPFDGSVSEITDVVVTVTQAAPVLTGTVRDASGNLMPGATVVALPASPATNSYAGLFPTRIKTAVAATNGVYRLTSLPAGDYLLVATERPVAPLSADPALLQALERSSTRRRLAWGQTHAVDLVLSGVR